MILDVTVVSEIRIIAGIVGRIRTTTGIGAGTSVATYLCIVRVAGDRNFDILVETAGQRGRPEAATAVRRTERRVGSRSDSSPSDMTRPSRVCCHRLARVTFQCGLRHLGLRIACDIGRSIVAFARTAPIDCLLRTPVRPAIPTNVSAEEGPKHCRRRIRESMGDYW
ncbi:hypothetical protein D8S78_04065 [Natrialba swarupiae]|nr:hypothetical protein [Natrialba swarupiae]